MYCINIKKRKGLPYCGLLKKQIKLSDCSNCEYKEYKTKRTINSFNKKNNNEKIEKFVPKKSSKISKLERDRKSILTNDLDTCIICGAKKKHLHEVFEGRNRIISMKYNCVIPVCFKCHIYIHNKRELSLIYKRMCQEKLEENMSREEFIKLFGINYLD